MNFKEILHHNYPVSDEAAKALYNACLLTTVRHGESIIQQGKVSNYLVFVVEGLFRVTFRYGDTEETLCFGVAGDPYCSMHSYYADAPAQYSFEAIEDSRCLVIDFEHFKVLKNKYPDLLRWSEQVLMEQIYALERRYAHLGTYDAYTRYTTLLKMRSEIINRIPLKYIAQYIKVQPETLSRLRARYAREKS